MLREFGLSGRPRVVIETSHPESREAQPDAEPGCCAGPRNQQPQHRSRLVFIIVIFFIFIFNNL